MEWSSQPVLYGRGHDEWVARDCERDITQCKLHIRHACSTTLRRSTAHRDELSTLTSKYAPRYWTARLQEDGGLRPRRHVIGVQECRDSAAEGVVGHVEHLRREARTVDGSCACGVSIWRLQSEAAARCMCHLTRFPASIRTGLQSQICCHGNNNGRDAKATGHVRTLHFYLHMQKHLRCRTRG